MTERSEAIPPTWICSTAAVVLVLGVAVGVRAEPIDSERAARVLAATLERLRFAEELASEDQKDDAYRRGRDLAEEAVELTPENPDAHYALFAHTGRLMMRTGTIPNPFNILVLRRSLARALELDPNHPAALTARGSMHRRLPRWLGRDLDAARSDLESAIARDPNLIPARVELARTWIDLDDPGRASLALEEARQLAVAQQREQKLAEIDELLHQLRPPTGP